MVVRKLRLPMLAAVPVGPHSLPWPADDRLDPDLLAHGDSRNVIDGYRYWRLEAIRADLALRRSPLHVGIENLEHDLNIGSIVRTANAFNASGVHVVGRRRWNRRGAMVSDAYLDVHHHTDPEALQMWARERGLVIVALENHPGAAPLEGFGWPRDTLLLVGQEGPGLSVAALQVADHTVAITQHGSTRSLNVAAAAAIAIHSWAVAHPDIGASERS